MTTTTDTGPDVQVTNADTGEIYPSEVRDRIDSLDGAASDTALHSVLADNAALRAELDRTRAELAALQAKVSPLEAQWTPPRNPPTLWTEETLIARWAAAHRDSYDTGGLIADSHRREREAVDSLLDYTEQATAHDPADVWDDALRGLTERVPVDYSYRQSEAWTWADTVRSLYEMRDGGVYAELAPDRLDEANVSETPKALTTGDVDNGNLNSEPAPADDEQGRRAQQRQHREILAPLAAKPEPPPEPRWMRVLRVLGVGA